MSPESTFAALKQILQEQADEIQQELDFLAKLYTTLYDRNLDEMMVADLVVPSLDDLILELEASERTDL